MRLYLDAEGSTPAQFDGVKQLEFLRTLDPALEARAAFNHGGRDLLALGGLVVWIPCLENRADLRNVVSHKKISGTGEETNAEFTHLAEQYALLYNKEMLRLITKGAELKLE